MNALQRGVLMLALGFSLATQACLPALSVDAVTAATSAPWTVPPEVRVIGTDPQAPELHELFTVHDDLLKASNAHKIEEILKHYSPQFISGDNLGISQLKDMIQETWKTYADIQYDSKVIEVRINGDWATMETVDSSTATAPPEKGVMDTPGRLKSLSRSLLFFRRLGHSWQVTSDSTIWEQATTRYGIGDDVKIILSAPEQVKAGTDYSVSIKANLPEGSFSFINIDNQPITYPQPKADDKFRTMAGDSNEIQRVLRANTANHNEVVVATLGVTSLEQKNPDRPSLSVNGITSIVQRVNVVPISQEDVVEEMKKQEMVRTSADGKIDLTRKPDIPVQAGPLAPAPDASKPESPATPEEDSAPQPNPALPEEEIQEE